MPTSHERPVSHETSLHLRSVSPVDVERSPRESEAERAGVEARPSNAVEPSYIPIEALRILVLAVVLTLIVSLGLCKYAFGVEVPEATHTAAQVAAATWVDKVTAWLAIAAGVFGVASLVCTTVGALLTGLRLPPESRAAKLGHVLVHLGANLKGARDVLTGAKSAQDVEQEAKADANTSLSTSTVPSQPVRTEIVPPPPGVPTPVDSQAPTPIPGVVLDVRPVLEPAIPAPPSANPSEPGRANGQPAEVLAGSSVASTPEPGPAGPSGAPAQVRLPADAMTALSAQAMTPTFGGKFPTGTA